MINFLSVIFLIFGILQIILFFKMWGMTNDVRKIKKKLLASENDEISEPSNQFDNTINDWESKKDEITKSSTPFQIGELVVGIKSGKQMRVKEILNEEYGCYTNNGEKFEGNYKADEIKPFYPRKA